jgi:hypothetical protein
LGRADHAYRSLFGHITYDSETRDTEEGTRIESKVIDAIKSNYMIGDGGASLGMRGLSNGLKEFRSLLYAGIATYLLRHYSQPQQSTVVIDLTETRYVDYGGGRTTRSQSAKQLSITSHSVNNNNNNTTATKTITPHLSYRVFTHPFDALKQLRSQYPGAFSRSVQCNIDERVHRQHDVGLVMVHSFAPHSHGSMEPQEPTLLYCMLNERLATAPRPNPLSMIVYPPVGHNDVAQQQQRRLLCAPRHARCDQCRRRHARSEPCPFNHSERYVADGHNGGALMDVEAEEEEDVALPEFSFSRISQFYGRALATTTTTTNNDNTPVRKTSKRSTPIKASGGKK